MEPRERVRASITHHQPDKVPVDFGSTNVTTIHIQAYKNLINRLNIKDENIQIMDYMQQLVVPCEKLLSYLNVDTRGIKLRSSYKKKGYFINDNEYLDDWGVLWKRPLKGLYFDAVDYPLKKIDTLADIKSYTFPGIDQLANNEGIREIAERLYKNTNYSLIGSFGSSIFMMAQLLRGYEQFLIDLMINKDIAEYLLDSILDIRIALADLLLSEAGEFLDVVEIADDLAGQNGLLISPQLYRSMIKPRTKKLVTFIKKKTNAKVMYHCCGSVAELLEDVIEIGIDIINPVQVAAKNMDTKDLKEKYGKYLTFWGAIDGQKVLPVGTKEDVIEETKKRVSDLLKNGGYVACASHNIQPDVPTENIISMFKCLREL